MLMKAGAKLDSSDSQGNSPLHTAAICNASAGILTRLAGEAGSTELTNRKGNTPLVEAAINRSLDAAKHLVALGANAGHANARGNTGVHAAAANNDVDTAAVFLRAGCKADACNRFGVAPIHAAAEKNSAEMIDVLIRHKCPVDKTNPNTGRSALHYAASADATSAAKCLVKHNADVNLLDNDRTTPILLATQHNSERAASMLLYSNANLNQPDRNGTSALQYAKDANRAGIVDGFTRFLCR